MAQWRALRWLSDSSEVTYSIPASGHFVKISEISKLIQVWSDASAAATYLQSRTA